MVEDKSPAKRPRRTPGNLEAAGTVSATPTARARRAGRESDSATTITAEERIRMVETAAYFRAARRGFEAGHEAEDWLAAEAEIDALIASARRAAAGTERRASRSRKPPSN